MQHSFTYMSNSEQSATCSSGSLRCSISAAAARYAWCSISSVGPSEHHVDRHSSYAPPQPVSISVESSNPHARVSKKMQFPRFPPRSSAHERSGKRAKWLWYWWYCDNFGDIPGNGEGKTGQKPSDQPMNGSGQRGVNSTRNLTWTTRCFTSAVRV